MTPSALLEGIVSPLPRRQVSFFCSSPFLLEFCLRLCPQLLISTLYPHYEYNFLHCAVNLKQSPARFLLVSHMVFPVCVCVCRDLMICGSVSLMPACTLCHDTCQILV